MIDIELAGISIRLENRYPDVQILCREYKTEKPPVITLRVSEYK